MSSGSPSAPRDVVMPAVFGGVVVMVVFGLARGLWLPNLHNGVLAVAFAGVGCYLAVERSARPLSRLFVATGVVEAVIFLGRQIGHASPSARWWAWLGVWPVVVALALTTLSIMCFPDGRLPSARWRPVAIVVVAVAAALATVSAAWPVEFASAGVVARHPFSAGVPHGIDTIWSAIAHPSYAGMQVLWIIAIAVRWRRSTGVVRAQLATLALAAGASVLALALGLALWRSPRMGLLAASLTPIVAGWAIVRGQSLVSYTALSWLSRSTVETKDLPTALARAIAEATGAQRAVLWIGDDELRPLGVWPETQDPMPTTFARLSCRADLTRRIQSGGQPVGAVSVDLVGDPQLSRTESRLLDDLGSQGRFVLEHMRIADVVDDARRHRRLGDLSPREQQVLELMATGMSNAAICDELHLSVKTVEPAISSIFTKLGLPPDSARNRRVLAVLAYVRSPSESR